MYNPKTMQWIQPDPTGAEYIDGMALQEFEDANPINRRDPTGLVATQPATQPANFLTFTLPSGDVAHDNSPKSGEIWDSVVSQKQLAGDGNGCKRIEVILNAHQRLGTKSANGTPNTDTFQKVLEWVVKKLPGGAAAAQLANALAACVSIGGKTSTMYRATMSYQLKMIYIINKDDPTKLTPVRSGILAQTLRFSWEPYSTEWNGGYGVDIPEDKEAWDGVRDAIKDVLDQLKGD
jgi:hypothetical protein